MALLSFITDEQFKTAVDKLLQYADNALKRAELEFNKNVIDPFSAMFEMSGFQLDEQAWKKSEKARKAQKSLSNYIGLFHQTILGHAAGWEDLGKGKQVDLISREHKIIAEIKNKHNTVKASDLSRLYKSLEDLVMPKESHYKGYTAYYVAIIPKRPVQYDDYFTPSDNSIGNCKPQNPLIREIDGFSFYKKVTGIDDALLQLFKALPVVIQESVHSKGYQFSNLQFLESFFAAAFAPVVEYKNEGICSVS